MISTEALSAIRVFVEVVTSGSFTRAGENIALSRSSVGKAITRLEARLGVPLFKRTTRKLLLTDEGQAFYLRSQRILSELMLAEEEIQHQRQQVAGLLRIELPVLFGREQVMPVLLQLAQQYPQLLLSVNFTNNLSQLAENALDLAVRIGQLPDTHNLTARALGIQDMVICASPACLAQYGQPLEASALQQLPCLTENPQAQWQLFDQQGQLRLITPQIRMAIKDVSALAQACQAGFGFARLPHWLVAEPLKQGLLVPVLPQSLPAGPPIHLIWDTHRFISLRMRVVIDALTAHFSKAS